MAGCFSTREATPSDAGRERPDAWHRGPIDASTPPDSGVDAFTPFPDHDAGPLGPARGTLLAAVVDRSDNSLSVYEMGGSTILRAVPIPGTTGLFDRGHRNSARIYVTRDGTWHVVEVLEGSDHTRRGYVHRFDPAAPGWSVIELPEDLRAEFGWFVVPEGSDLIFAVPSERDEVRVVRWNGEILAETRVDFESGGTLYGFWVGGDGYIYLHERGGDEARLHALDPSDLHLVRTLRPTINARAYRVDVDASVLAVDLTSERLTRWTPSGALVAGPRVDREVVMDISRDGFVIAGESTSGSVQVYTRDLELVGYPISPMAAPSIGAMSWAWSAPAAR